MILLTSSDLFKSPLPQQSQPKRACVRACVPAEADRLGEIAPSTRDVIELTGVVLAHMLIRPFPPVFSFLPALRSYTILKRSGPRTHSQGLRHQLIHIANPQRPWCLNPGLVHFLYLLHDMQSRTRLIRQDVEVECGVQAQGRGIPILQDVMMRVREFNGNGMEEG